MKVCDSFNQVCSNVLMMEEFPNASLAYRLLLQEERHHTISKLTTSIVEPVAFSVDRNSHERLYNHTNTSYGQKHYKGSHVTGNKRSNNTYYCDHCHMTGHTIDRCYKLHGYLNKHKYHNTKRIAAFANDTGSMEKEDIKHTGLTVDQFTHLCALLGKKEPPQDTTLLESLDIPSTANIAGLFNDKIHASW
ncbi:uncharacterized protein LOC130804164 [Amaranthus tricolor]|uniref:uncharacterized protein LOC130804164 n=1 Tax=Amaranthus tricolor TaxID=29722 RepID=UPI00258D465F|nr:uncharacterized protein LOC130804164 [Amaranthus tricolor]